MALGLIMIITLPVAVQIKIEKAKNVYSSLIICFRQTIKSGPLDVKKSGVAKPTGQPEAIQTIRRFGNGN
jgi:hypothetical protein